MVVVPAVAEEAAARVSVTDPVTGFKIVMEEKVAVTPLGNPLTASASGALNPPVALVCNVTVVFCPRTTVTEVEVELRMKNPTVTVTITEGVGVMPALDPFIVIG